MNLQTYLETAGLTQAEFASRIGTTHATISRLIAGKFLPSLKLAVAIERASGDIVKANSWVPLEKAA